MWGGGGGGMFSSGTTGWQIESSSKFAGGGGGMMGMGFTGPLWLNKLWTSDATYKAAVKKRWAELRSGVWHDKTMDKYLDSMKVYLKNGADRNFKRWPNLGKASGTYDSDPQPLKECSQGGGQQGGGQQGGMWGGMWGGGGGGMGMAMGGYNATTWDGEFEHVRKKMKERMKWMDDQLGFTLPANPVVTAPVDPEIHEPHWQAASRASRASRVSRVANKVASSKVVNRVASSKVASMAVSMADGSGSRESRLATSLTITPDCLRQTSTPSRATVLMFRRAWVAPSPLST